MTSRVIAGFAAILLLGGCASANLSTSNASDNEPAKPATVPVTRGDVEQTVTAPGQLINTHEQVLSFDVSGRLIDLAVQPGDAVQKGKKLASIDASSLQVSERQAYADYQVAQAEYRQVMRGPSAAEVNAVRAELSSAQTAYGELQKPPSDNEVAGLRAALLNAEATLKRAQAEYDRAFAFDPAGIGASPAALELEKATNDYNAAKANYDKAFEKAGDGDLRNAAAKIASVKAKLDALQPSAEKVDTAKAQFEKARLNWMEAQAKLRKTDLIAPMDGVVVEVRLRDGETANAGDPVIMLMDPQALQVRASVIEEDLPLVQIGQRVSLFFDAAPDASVSGKVARISPKRMEGDRPLYPIYIDLSGTSLPQGLAPGMSADASVIIARAEDVLRLPRAVVKAGAGGTARVEVWANGARERRVITVGLRGDTYVEIIDGLREGEEVIGE